MKITKYNHACLLVETPEGVALFDPGNFSEDVLDVGKIEKLDHIIITHEHGDHFSIDLVQKLVAKFPKVCVVSTEAVMDQLQEKGIGNYADCKSDESIKALEWTHESMEPLMPGPSPCENVGIHFADALTHPGDSFKATESKAVFAMPIAGPWGSAVEGIRLAVKLKPKYVAPIHDGMWNDAWRDNMYAWCEGYFASQGITFLKLKDGEPVEVTVGE